MREEFHAFSTQDQPVALTNPADIDLLIVFILQKLDGLSKAQVLEALTSSGSANYLEAAQCVSNLVARGALLAEGGDDDAPLHITQNARSALAVLGDNLPRSVGEKALRAALKLQSMRRNLNAHKAEIEEVPEGFFLHLSIEEQEMSVFSLRLFVAEKIQARTMRDSFLCNPSAVLDAVGAVLL
ncbi:MAG: DUF4364 family protein [Oscillospiraceae bacterium]|nr:DUF4364 family protein [Oscillospiraceae bacterium]